MAAWAAAGNRALCFRACRRAFFRIAADLPLRTARALAKSPFAWEKRVGLEVGLGR